MEILKIDLSRLRNEEHYNFNTEVNDLVIRFTAEALKIQRCYPAFESALADESRALDVVRKSIFTGPIADADHTRDNTTLGMEDLVDAALRHFRPKVREAARRLKIVFDSFDGLTTKPYDQQTAGTTKLIGQLEGEYADDVASVGIAAWVSELKANNQAVIDLVGERYTAETGKPPLKMKETRKALDKAYRDIVRLVDALIIVEGSENHAAFVGELNERIEKYNNRLAQRDGRNNKEDEGEE